MKQIKIVIYVFSLVFIFIVDKLMSYPAYTVEYLDSMAIHIAPGENRPYVYSGEGSAFFYGTTGDQVNGHMGFYVGENKLWDDFEIIYGGKKLKRSEAAVEFMPHQAVFRWENGITLKIMPLSREKNYLKFQFDGNNKSDKIVFNFIYSTDLSAQNGEFSPIFRQIFPDDREYYSTIFLLRRGTVEIVGKHIVSADKGQLVFLYDESLTNLPASLNYFKEVFRNGQSDRIDWCLEEINRSYFHCNDETVNKALNWMKISLASLFAENGSALYAGLPWFNDCWGRDTFISLPGACLVQGKFDYAKRLLQRFAEWQCKDSTSTDYGRIPNRVRAGEIVYNTADGTPWFVREIYEYGIYSGDYDFWKQMTDAGVLERAFEGTFKYHCDEYGLLAHRDAETWMDAVGPNSAWTPRGNRAVEIQALWWTQMKVTDQIYQKYFDIMDYDSLLQIQKDVGNAKWLFECNFTSMFLRPDSLGLFDHINSNGTTDKQIRPNQLFALTIPFEKIVPDLYRQKIIETALKHYIYPYGSASLSQNDRDFHPYHRHYLYPKDAAYHNGTVWTWLSGAYKSATGGGWTIAKNEMDIALNYGAPGTLSELLDAVPAKGESLPKNSGTVSQAWSLAEFIRTFYQDYIGLKPDYDTDERNTWFLNPHLPAEIDAFTAVLHLQDVKAKLSFKASPDTVELAMQALTPVDRWVTVLLPPPFGFFHLKDSLEYKLTFKRTGNQIEITNRDSAISQYELFLPPEKAGQYLQPSIAANLKALQPPKHRLLSGAEIKIYNPISKVVCDLTDPPGDDVGGGEYTYPTEANFKPGILDLTRFVTRYDEENVYFRLEFRDLVQPGWHPEYGFQLTFAAICLNTGGSPRNLSVGHNSGWTLKKGYEADRFICVGGGLFIEDGKHRILAEHIPWDTGYELGDVTEKRINFAIPRVLLPGKPENWKITVLIGAQDDHGGAGIGEFRQVNEKASRWAGGGKKPGGGNVYDWAVFPNDE